ncbi:MAG: hypothetical protein K9K66_06250 [Desulfarculaceae bacterium]|nr:hypothetical protein [Desulfarculaceae bacterium]MCF8071154.1 hypothetical protein [Desulfarculaceae bacterium]MCF8101243.1 hypothetical protein [Desulfarculaceae bacterium]MCF8115208.1 hypothetical protein [Desulfarculaceae bacterium]
MMGCTIDIDTGGTFTDGYFVQDGRVATVKVSTTPHDLTVCFQECIKAGAMSLGLDTPQLLYQTDIIRFSNTIGTNTIIQRNGSKIGMLVSRGVELINLLKPETPAPAGPPAPPAPVSLCLRVEDLDGLHQRLSDAGWHPFTPVAETPTPTGEMMRIFCIRTEENVLWEFIEIPEA